MKTVRATYQVQLDPKTKKKRWIILRNDLDPETVGDSTNSGMPAPAANMGTGSTFFTILLIA